MFQKSIIVSAHPDDEILWFSSILEEVDEIIFCFLNHKSEPDWTAGRQKTLSEYPMKNVFCLGLEVAEVFDCANWQNPVITKFGIQISDNSISDKKYRENYFNLTKDLEKRLVGYRNVFTHNPWGEYGHEEHVQLYRVIKKLQKGMDFNLWFSNYCSNKSFNLMLEYISGFHLEYKTLTTNKKRAAAIRNLYKNNRCWTWYDDWEWFNEESFMKDNSPTKPVKIYGHFFPVNMIKVDFPGKSKRKVSILDLLLNKMLINRKKK